MVGVLIGALALTSSPAFAQAMGSLRGKIVDQNGEGVPEAEITLEYGGDVQITVTFKTNTRGEFVRSGLRTGPWRLQATKGDLIGRNPSVVVTIANMTQLEPLMLRPASEVAASTDTSDMTADEVAARNKMAEEMKAMFAAGDAALDTDPDAALAQFEAVAAKVPECAVCYTRIGEAHLRRKDDAAAEAAFLKATELDPKSPDAFSALAGIYNRQKKFAEASKMSAKAVELQGAAGGAAGGGNAADTLNLGIIAWNAGEYPEAKKHFEQAVKIDPKLADAHYRLGMANVNLGLLPEAIVAFEEYLKLAPDGEHAELTKGILKSIKGGTPLIS
jgi:Tfp pilus assembly protein PilF